MPDQYIPRREDKFSFGLWTVGNRGRDPFGEAVRDPLPPDDAVALLAEAGAWGVNLHDNDLVPIDASPSERDRIVRGFKSACERHAIVVPMATVNLFYDPVFRDGAFTANDPRVRAYAVQKTMRAMDLGAELGARIFVLWGGREGTETDACRRPNEPRGDIYMATTGAYLGFIPTLDHPEMVGVNPEVAHEHMAGLNFLHSVAQAWEAGKLFHVDLNDQVPGRYDQDFRFGSANVKSAFHLVKFLEDVGYDGPRHFDAHSYRTEDYQGVLEFARGCMRTYLILRERAKQWHADGEIQALVASVGDAHDAPAFSSYSARNRDAL